MEFTAGVDIHMDIHNVHMWISTWILRPASQEMQIFQNFSQYPIVFDRKGLVEGNSSTWRVPGEWHSYEMGTDTQFHKRVPCTVARQRRRLRRSNAPNLNSNRYLSPFKSVL